MGEIERPQKSMENQVATEEDWSGPSRWRRVLRPCAPPPAPGTPTSVRRRHRTDALAHGSGGLGPDVTDRGEDLQDVGAADLGYGPPADTRERVAFEAAQPDLRLPGTARQPLCFSTRWAASVKVGMPWTRGLSTNRSPPERESLRLASACSRALASVTQLRVQVG